MITPNSEANKAGSAETETKAGDFDILPNEVLLHIFSFESHVNNIKKKFAVNSIKELLIKITQDSFIHSLPIS